MCIACAALFVILYTLTLGCMAYCMISDPGQVACDCKVMPERAHNAWICERPIRRYDHYCRWLMNGIGLLNHREFFCMLVGLVLAAVLGVVVDSVAILMECSRQSWLSVFASTMHLAYCLLIGRFVGSILYLHVGFISRNELCSDWKEDLFWRVDEETVVDGQRVGDLEDEETSRLEGRLVRELSIDTYDALDLNTVRYDASLNKYDKGWRQNWWSFWFTPRWTPEQTGDF